VGPIVNDGILTLDIAGCGSGFAEVRSPAGATISGSGEIRLTTPNTGTSARLIGDGGPGAPITLGTGQLLTGTGTLAGHINTAAAIELKDAGGTPNPIGQLALSGVTLAMTGSSSLEIDIASAGSFDNLTGTGSVHVDGLLTLDFGAFSPAHAQTFDIVAATSVTGSFDVVVVTPSAIGVRMDYLADRVRVRVCRADTNGDGVLSPADFSAWVAAFNSAGPACDQNADTLCTPADFSAWVANYNAGC